MTNLNNAAALLSITTQVFEALGYECNFDKNELHVRYQGGDDIVATIKHVENTYRHVFTVTMNGGTEAWPETTLGGIVDNLQALAAAYDEQYGDDA